MEHKCDKCGQMAALPNRENIPCIRGACNGKMKPLKEKQAHSSVSSSTGLEGSWTNGSWTIQWLNEDEILITGPYDQKGKMCGGDFESILSGLCSVRKAD